MIRIKDRFLTEKIMVKRHFYELYRRIFFFSSSFPLRYKKASVLKVRNSDESFDKKEIRLIKHSRDMIRKEVKFVNMSKKIP